LAVLAAAVLAAAVLAAAARWALKQKAKSDGPWRIPVFD
jgi:hypothetical protein